MDWNKIFGLLHITDLAKNWPALKPLHDAAMKELVQHSQDAAKQMADEAAKEYKERQEKAAAAAEKAAREAAEDLKPARRPEPQPDMVRVPSQAGEREDGMPEPTPQGLARP